MRTGRSSNTDSATNIVVLTAEAAFAEQARTTFGNGQVELKVVIGTLAMSQGEGFDLADVTVVVIDLDATDPDEMTALECLIAQVGTWPPVVVVTQAFDAAL